MMPIIRHVTAFAAHRCLEIVTVASLVFAAAGVARAVDSGWVRWIPDIVIPSGTTLVWLKAGVREVQLIRTTGVGNSGCVQIQWNVPSAQLGVEIGGFKNGGLCGFTQRFSTTSTAQFCSEVRMCSDPSGFQVFKSDVAGLVWTGNAYEPRGRQNSPSINH